MSTTEPASTTSTKKPFYKRWWFILLVIVVVIVGIGGATGSGDDTQQGNATTSTGETESEEQAPDEEEAEIVAGIGDTVQSGDFEITVNSVGDPTETIGSDFTEETAQGEYIPVNISLTNTGSEAGYVFDNDITLQAGETTYSSSSDALFALDDAFVFEEINPGNTLSGTLAFDVPAGTAIDGLVFSGGIFDEDAIVKIG
ncbi:MAG: DUF4352 domain-containing protein [Ancrocorticia sp.]|uniref:DUF4352 domain-containing protein n=1 Tax=Ancrocorticia sp. TaxID=2593684 RepID=UPI003F8EEEA6